MITHFIQTALTYASNTVDALHTFFKSGGGTIKSMIQNLFVTKNHSAAPISTQSAPPLTLLSNMPLDILNEINTYLAPQDKKAMGMASQQLADTRLQNSQALHLKTTQDIKDFLNNPRDNADFAHIQTLHIQLSGDVSVEDYRQLLAKLGNVHTLSLTVNTKTSERMLKTFLSAASSVGKLQHLSFEGDINDQPHFSTLPANIAKLSTLKSLHLVNLWNLTALPPELGKLSQLQTLTLQGLSLQSLPSGIGKLTQLQTLTLMALPVYTLRPELENLTQLQTLTLVNLWDLTALPPELGNLIQLRTLTLESLGKLTALPPTLENLPQLQIIRQ